MTIRSFISVLIAGCVVACGAATSPGDLSVNGSWSGTTTAGGTPLAVSLRLTESDFSVAGVHSVIATGTITNKTTGRTYTVADSAGSFQSSSDQIPLLTLDLEPLAGYTPSWFIIGQPADRSTITCVVIGDFIDPSPANLTLKKS